MIIRCSMRGATASARMAILLASFAVITLAFPVHGEVSAPPPLFGFGPQQVGAAIGYGHGVKFGGSGEIDGHRVEELILLAHWQIDITRAPISNSWLRGRTSFRAEATYFHNFEPHPGDAGGLALLLRYHFLYSDRVQPFVQAGAGFLAIEMDLAEQSDGFAFQPQAAVGILWRQGPNHSVELAWRFHHISNADTKSRNGGIDRSQFVLGYAYHF